MRQSKQIRLNQEVYDELEEVRLKRETFSQVVARLIRAYTTLNNVLKDAGVQEAVSKS